MATGSECVSTISQRRVRFRLAVTGLLHRNLWTRRGRASRGGVCNGRSLSSVNLAAGKSVVSVSSPACRRAFMHDVAGTQRKELPVIGLPICHSNNCPVMG